MPHSRALATLLVVALVVCQAACQTAPRRSTTRVTEVFPGSTAVREVQPSDIAVMPIVDRSDASAPTDVLRREFYRGLVDRLYSPLRLDYVDRAWTEASFGEGAGADAVLQIVLTRWDASALATRDAIVAGAELTLFDADDVGGTPLWGVRVVRRLGRLGEDGRDPVQEAAERFASEALALLPERDAAAAPRGDQG